MRFLGFGRKKEEEPTRNVQLVRIGGKMVDVELMEMARQRHRGGRFYNDVAYHIGTEVVTGRSMNDYFAAQSDQGGEIPHTSIDIHKDTFGSFQLTTAQGNTRIAREQLAKKGAPTSNGGGYYVPDNEKGKIGRTVYDNANTTAKAVMGAKNASERDIADRATRFLGNALGSLSRALDNVYEHVEDPTEARMIAQEVRRQFNDTPDEYSSFNRS